MRNIFVQNSLVEKFYPSIKLQKPGKDFYNIIIAIQVLMCSYILFLYPEMEAEQSTLLYQVTRNQFSGNMVVVLATMILIMSYERYIYKSKTFHITKHSHGEGAALVEEGTSKV